MIAHGCSFPLKGKSRQLLMRRGRDRGGSEHPQGWCSSSTRKVLGCSPGSVPHPWTGGVGGLGVWEVLLHGLFALPPPALSCSPSSQNAFLWGTHWDLYLSIQLNARLGEQIGGCMFFSPSWLPAFWTAEVVLNHCKLQRAPTALSHSPGKHFITGLYFFPNRYYILYSENTNPTSSPGEKSSVGNLV